jgi:hypothetical protein
MALGSQSSIRALRFLALNDFSAQQFVVTGGDGSGDARVSHAPACTPHCICFHMYSTVAWPCAHPSVHLVQSYVVGFESLGQGCCSVVELDPTTGASRALVHESAYSAPVTAVASTLHSDERYAVAADEEGTTRLLRVTPAAAGGSSHTVELLAEIGLPSTNCTALDIEATSKTVVAVGERGSVEVLGLDLRSVVDTRTQGVQPGRTRRILHHTHAEAGLRCSRRC